MKYKLLTASALLATTLSPFANATITWDPDGTGGSFGALQLGAFDWNQSSFVARGGNTAIANFLLNQATGSELDTSFQVYTHAKLTGANDPANNLIALPGLGSSFEYTVVLGFYETVTDVLSTQEIAFFRADTSRASFLEIYYDNKVDSDALTGSGFNNGQLILRASLGNNAEGNFDLNSSQSFVDLDQSSNGNQYTGQTTRTGTGSQEALLWNVVEQDLNFFKDPLDVLGIGFSNISIALPFKEVDPSDCFTQTAKGALGNYAADTQCDTAHVNGVLNPLTQPLGVGYTGYIPDIASQNTILPLPGATNVNPDFMAQTDFNSSFSGTPVPEPTSLLMLAAGLLGVFGVASRKQTA